MTESPAAVTKCAHSFALLLRTELLHDTIEQPQTPSLESGSATLEYEETQVLGELGISLPIRENSHGSFWTSPRRLQPLHLEHSWTQDCSRSRGHTNCDRPDPFARTSTYNSSSVSCHLLRRMDLCKSSAALRQLLTLLSVLLRLSTEKVDSFRFWIENLQVGCNIIWRLDH